MSPAAGTTRAVTQEDWAGCTAEHPHREHGRAATLIRMPTTSYYSYCSNVDVPGKNADYKADRRQCGGEESFSSVKLRCVDSLPKLREPSSTRFSGLQQLGYSAPPTVRVPSTRPATCSHLQPPAVSVSTGLPWGSLGAGGFPLLIDFLRTETYSMPSSSPRHAPQERSPALAAVHVTCRDAQEAAPHQIPAPW